MKPAGKHPERALTAAFVRTVKEPGKYFDGHGLILKVDRSGARRWIQRINIRGKRTELGLGSAALVSLSEARETALENRKIARQGGDPLNDRRSNDAAPTFQEAAKTVFEMHRPSWRNPKHAAQFMSTLETYAFPRLANRQVSEITAADVLAVLHPIWLQKSETARRVRQRIGMIMKWSIAQGLRQDNPADAIAQALPKQARDQKHRKALHYSEVAECLAAVRRSNGYLSTKLAFELLVLTACRSGEIRLAEWDEFDMDKAEWLIPAARMKANRDHKIPLSMRAIEVLLSARQVTDSSSLVFPSTKFAKPLSDMTLLKLVRGLGFNVDVHGFRTSFKTWAQEQTDYPREVSEAALAHTIRDKAEAAYARSDLFEKRRVLMEDWSVFVSAKDNT